MKALFQKRLLLVIVLAFLLANVGYYLIARVYARNDALRLLRDNLSFACALAEDYDYNLEEITSISKANVLSGARQVAMYVNDNPTSLKDAEQLTSFTRTLAVLDYMITDEKGVVVLSSVDRLIGFDLSSTPETREFLSPITDPDAEIVKVPKEELSIDAYLYACVARIDAPGVVLVGYGAEDLAKAWKFADVSEIEETFCVGHNGEIRITPNLCGWKEGSRAFRADVYDIPSLCVSTPCEGHILTASLPFTEVYHTCNTANRALIVANLVLFTAMFILVSRLLQVVVVKEVYALNNSLAKITAGELDERASVTSTPEFAALSEGVNKTVDALRLAIEKESKRISSELEMSRLIQTSMLPTDGDFAFGDYFQLAASMQPATAVGGDFYDFFSIDESRFAALISDVSGHGIAPALFMASSKTLIKDLLQSGLAPEEAYTKANQKLCVNNAAGMFLTSFLLVADVGKHTLTCVNAGHNPPLIKSPNGSWEYLEIEHSLMLGAWDEAEYVGVSVPFEPGAKILLYTDGVTEGMNSKDELFGEERLKNVLNDEENGSAEDTVNLVRESVAKHANGTPQSDDVTIVCVGRRR